MGFNSGLKGLILVYVIVQAGGRGFGEAIDLVLLSQIE
jgi:hypothetical protein